MLKVKKAPNQDKRDQRIGRMLVNVYETGYLDRNTFYKMSFIKGVLYGFGGVVGATIVVGLLLWVLTFFNEIPLVGQFSDNLKQTIEQ